ncbi:MAG: carbohydrate binding domain-containing protein [Elusimicrobiota bacterium]
MKNRSVPFFSLLPFYLFTFLPSTLECKTIDDMDSSWEISTDTDTVASVAVSENANKMDYNFGDGDWIELGNETFADLDISSGDAIRFYFKGSGSENHLKLQIYDADGDVFDRKISGVTALSQWTEMIVPFYSLSHSTEVGNGVLDTKKISKLAFAVAPSAGGSGTIAIDKVESYQLNTSTFLVSSFNFGTPPNEAGGNEGAMSFDGLHDPAVSYDSENVYEGIYALKLLYSCPTNWCGYYIFLSSAGNAGYRDISQYTHLKFWVKSDAPGKKFKTQLDYVGRSTSPPEVNIVSATTFYQEMSIPISSFSGLISSQTKQVNFVFNDPGVYEGILYIDNIRFTSTATYTGVSGAVSTIDDMNSLSKISGWINYGKDEDTGITTTKLANATGLDGGAIELQYSFNRSPISIDDWVVIENDWGTNIADCNSIKFQYKGTGANNNLELSIADKNGTSFRRKFFKITNTENVWKEIVVPFGELSLLKSGKDSDGEDTDTLDLTKIKSVYFTIAKNAGGSGTVSIKNLESNTKSSFESQSSDKIIKSFKHTNNPFSPNNDGIKDKAIFMFTLSEVARVKLVIYDLSGEAVYENDVGSLQANTEQTIEWIGVNNSGAVVHNGMYFYQFTAETDSKKDKVTHVVGVIR